MLLESHIFKGPGVVQKSKQSAWCDDFKSKIDQPNELISLSIPLINLETLIYFHKRGLKDAREWH